MATLTVYPDVGDGRITSSSTTYSTARAGSGTLSVDSSGTNFPVGQFFSSPDYEVYQAFLRFDTSSLGAGASVSAAVLSLVLVTDSATTDFTIEARVSTFGGTVDSSDFIAGGSLTSPSIVASRTTNAVTSAGTRYDLTSIAGFPAAINTTGNTDLSLASSRQRTNSTPSGSEAQAYASANTSGTTNDPAILITYTVASTGTLAVTLGALTGAATGKALVQGSTSATLGALTASATGAVLVKGTLGSTLGAATLAGTGTVTSSDAVASDGLVLGEVAGAIRHVTVSASDGLVLGDTLSSVRTTYSVATDDVILSDDATAPALMQGVATDSLIVSEVQSARKLWEPEAEDTATWETQAVSGDIWTTQTTDNATWTPRG